MAVSYDAKSLDLLYENPIVNSQLVQKVLHRQEVVSCILTKASSRSQNFRNGGGTRGFSSLLILKGLMEAIDPQKPPKPCEYFDMIGGSGTGGLIAILLGRLCLSISEATTVFTIIAQKTFTERTGEGQGGNIQGRYSSEIVRNAIIEVFRDLSLDPRHLLLLQDLNLRACNVFVTATSYEASRTVALTNYRHCPDNDPCAYRNSTVTVEEAIRATLAVSNLFSSGTRLFIEGGIAHNNPVKRLLWEAYHVWLQRSEDTVIGCIVSIGTGRLSGLDSRSFSPIQRALIAIAKEAERTSDEVACLQSCLQETLTYFRFALDDVSRTDLDDTKQLSKQRTLVERYLTSNRGKLTECRKALSSQRSEGVELQKELLMRFFQSDDDYTSHANLKNDWMLYKKFISSLCLHPGTAELLEQSTTSMVCQEFQEAFAVLLSQSLNALTDSKGVNKHTISRLKSLIKGRKWIARLVWVRVIDLQHLGKGRSAALGLTGLYLDGRPFVAESDKIKIGRNLQDSDVVSDHDDIMDYFFKGSIIQEFLYRFRFILSGSFLQLALFDRNESRICDLLDRREVVESPRPSSSSTIQRLLDPSNQIHAGESEQHFDIDSIPSDGSYSDESFMVVCDWELPTFLSLPNISLINDDFKDVNGLREFYQALHSQPEDHELVERWHNTMSVILMEIRNMVVLIGDDKSIRAGTCGELMEELCEGDLGLTLLNQVLYYAAGALASLPNAVQVVPPREAVDSTYVLRVTETSIMVLFDNIIPADRLSMTKALIWLCQTLRCATEPSCQALHQSATWNAVDYHEWQADRVSAFILKPLQGRRLDPKNDCWQGFFRSGIISYRSSSRSWGKGLQIPFSMMVQLAAVDNYLWVDAGNESNGEGSTISSASGGYILYGFYTALIPTDYDIWSNSIQWHFERSPDEIINPFAIQSTQLQWYKFQDYQRFASCTCFVGWCEVANIMLGTKELPNMVAWSGLPSRTRTLHKRGKTLVGQLGISGPIPIQATVQGEMSYTYVNNVQNFSPGALYARAINETSRQVALVYDSGVGKAWLVPKLSLLLHLCHRYFAFFKFSESTTEDPIPFASPSWNGAEAARQALYDKGDVVLQWHGVNDIDRILLRQVLVDININISDTSKTRELPDKATFFGSELMTMVAKPEMLSNGLGKMASKDASESWYGLVEYVDAVFVCSNIGPAIQPCLPAAVSNCHCVEIPEKRQYLAAHMWCLEVILQRRGIDINKLSSEVLRINKSYEWCLNGQPFKGCLHDCQQFDDYWKDVEAILQKISRRHLLSSELTPTSVVTPPPIRGTVIFGSRSSLGWLKRKRSSGS